MSATSRQPLAQPPATENIIAGSSQKRASSARQSLHPTRPRWVVLAEVVPRHLWENLLHNQTSLRLKLRLFGRKNTIVVDVPFHLGGD